MSAMKLHGPSKWDYCQQFTGESLWIDQEEWDTWNMFWNMNAVYTLW